MYRTLVKEFPQLEYWVLGYEPNFEFYDCEGKRLGLEELIVFFADTLEECTTVIKSVAPETTVIAGFLGGSGSPITVDNKLIQPRTIVALVEAEISQRGGRQSDYFDEWITSLDATLYEDRYPTEPTMFFPGSGEAKSGGWGTTYWHDDFDRTASDLNDDADYDFDDPILHTGLVPVDIDVDEGNDRAELRLENVVSGKESIAAMMTEYLDPHKKVVPDEDFDSDTLERNLWTAVGDFYPVQAPSLDKVHFGVFIRCHDRPDLDEPNPTHFGTISYDRDAAHGGICGANDDEGCGGLQFQGGDEDGDDIQGLILYELSAEISSGQHRLQILEREYFHLLNLSWQLQWRSEVWKLGSSPALGYWDWVWEWTVENVYGVMIPELDGSAFIASYCCQDGDAGDIDVNYVGTVAWDY